MPNIYNLRSHLHKPQHPAPALHGASRVKESGEPDRLPQQAPCRVLSPGNKIQGHEPNPITVRTKETRNMETKETNQPKKQNARIMELTPNWQSFFELSKQIVTAHLPEDAGRSVVLEMLDYGQRLDRQSNKEGE